MAQTEPKCKLFAWLVMHDRVLNTDNLVKRQWPCDYNCALCLYLHKTTEHLLTQCNFAEAAWNITASQFGLPPSSVMAAARGPKQWISFLLQAGSKEKKKNLGILLTFWWIIWKERNKRIFKYKEVFAVRLAHLVIGDVKLHDSVLRHHI
jgi:hypothetical protein